MNAHSKIEQQIVVAEDRTITLPASVSESAGWMAGSTIEVSAGPAKVELSMLEQLKDLTSTQVFALLREINPYRGPKITDEQIDEICAAAAIERYQRTL